MTREEAIKVLNMVEAYGLADEAKHVAIEALKAKCPTCKWCSGHQESGTRCPIEEHYALPKDGFCHLYEPCKPESEDKK